MANSMDMSLGAIVPAQNQYKKRLGLFPARIGFDFAHALGVAMPLTPPDRSTNTAVQGGLARTTISRGPKHYEMGKNLIDGTPTALKALPGATVMLPVQDFSRLEPHLAAKVRWECRHPDCKGSRYESREALLRDHADNRTLIEEAEKSVNPTPHVYLGVIEIEGKDARPEVRGEDGKIVKQGVAAEMPTVMLVSDET
jgi:hypothetical protein